MILVWGIVLGLGAGIMRALWAGCQYQPPDVRGVAVLVVAFVPQFLVFFFPLTRELASDSTAAFALVVSQSLLLAVVWLNRRSWAFWLMGFGLCLNLAVILANGGFMPISPDTILRLVPDYPAAHMETGQRLGTTKDIVLPVEATRLAWLSDRFTAPDWYPQRWAFSPGDVLIAAGAWTAFWISGRCASAGHQSGDGA